VYYKISGYFFTGLVTQLSPEFYSFMAELQSKLAKVIRSVGKIEHAEYPMTVSEFIKPNWLRQKTK